MLQTERDAQIVAWVGRMGGASAIQVSERFDMYPTNAHVRLRLMRKSGLLDYYRLLFNLPAMYTATRRGLRWQGLDTLSAYRLSLSTFVHTWQATGVAVALERAMPSWQLLSEREIGALERDRGELVASTRMNRPGFRTMLHRADLALVSPSGSVAAIEVELSNKGQAALRKICRARLRARHVAHVYYLAEGAVKRSVERAVQAERAGNLITVLSLDDTTGIAERELAREEASPDADVGGRAPAEVSESSDLWQLPDNGTCQIDSREADDVLGA